MRSNLVPPTLDPLITVGASAPRSSLSPRIASQRLAFSMPSSWVLVKIQYHENDEKEGDRWLITKRRTRLIIEVKMCCRPNSLT